MIVAVLGLGEAGGVLARDLIAAGASVRGWDPDPRALPDGLDLAASNCDAVTGAEVILSVNWSSVAVDVATEVTQTLHPNQLYADLNTAAPQNKRDVAAIVERSGAGFIDAALMSPVLPKGLASPFYASGSGAKRFAEKMSPLGMSITVLEGDAGVAATHKLVRSIMYKGVAAVVMECVEAAEALDMSGYARQQMMTLLQDESMIDRFVSGSKKHAKRRMHEMEAVVELLDSINVSAYTSQASVKKLKDLL